MLSDILINTYSNKTINLNQQDHSQASYSRSLSRLDGFISPSLLAKSMEGLEICKNELPLLIKDYLFKNKFSNAANNTRLLNSAYTVYNMYLGLYGWPGIWTNCTYMGNKRRLKIIDMNYQNNKIYLVTVQIEGKKPASYLEIKDNICLKD